MPQTTSCYHEIYMHFSFSDIKFGFWTLIHPVPHGGEHSCPCAWADGLLHLLVIQNTANLPSPPSWAHTPWRDIWLSSTGGWVGTYAGTWWGLTLDLGMGNRPTRRSRKFYVCSHVKISHVFKKALWYFVPFDCLCEMTLSGIVSVSRDPQMMPIHLLILRIFPT